MLAMLVMQAARTPQVAGKGGPTRQAQTSGGAMTRSMQGSTKPPGRHLTCACDKVSGPAARPRLAVRPGFDSPAGHSARQRGDVPSRDFRATAATAAARLDSPASSSARLAPLLSDRHAARRSSGRSGAFGAPAPAEESSRDDQRATRLLPLVPRGSSSCGGGMASAELSTDAGAASEPAPGAEEGSVVEGGQAALGAANAESPWRDEGGPAASAEADRPASEGANSIRRAADGGRPCWLGVDCEGVASADAAASCALGLMPSTCM